MSTFLFLTNIINQQYHTFAAGTSRKIKKILSTETASDTDESTHAPSSRADGYDTDDSEACDHWSGTLTPSVGRLIHDSLPSALQQTARGEFADQVPLSKICANKEKSSSARSGSRTPTSGGSSKDSNPNDLWKVAADGSRR